ncbi:MAG: response regulator transcription factor [Sulfitobacter sp.]
MRSALELILADLELPYVAADDPSEVPPDVSVVLLSYTTTDALSECIAACMNSPEPVRIVLFPQDGALFENVHGFPADVAAVVPPTLAAAEIRSVISLVVEGHRILPFTSRRGERASETSHPDRLKPGLLTVRQLEILGEVAKGQSNKAIARTLCISINTVEAHVSRIIRRLQVDNRTQAAMALREGMPLPKPVVRRRDGGGVAYGAAALHSPVGH